MKFNRLWEQGDINTMCDRYSLGRKEAEVDLDGVPLRIQMDHPRFNIAPTQMAPVIRLHEGVPVANNLRWGLIPSTAKNAKVALSGINARSETVADTGVFRAAFLTRRCLIPADGFYAWLPKGKLKIPFRFVRPTGGSFVFAGLWESWQPTDAPMVIETSPS